jgi:hypothetical protein
MPRQFKHPGSSVNEAATNICHHGESNRCREHVDTHDNRKQAMKHLAATARAGLVFAIAWTFCPPAVALDLNGTWASSSDICDKLFVKQGDKIVFAKNADEIGTGLIINGKQITGKIGSCNVTSRQEAGDVVHLKTMCTTKVATTSMDLSYKILSEDSISQVFSGLSGSSVRFVRCPK